MSAVDALAHQVDLSRDDTLELAIRAALDQPGAPFARLWDAYRHGTTQTPGDVADALAAAHVFDGVRGFRLRTSETIGWPTSLLDDPVKAWPAIRGPWRLRPAGVGVIVGLHLGLAVAVYRIGGWTQDLESGRHTAIEGRAITEQGRLVAVATGADIGAANPTDMAIHAAVTTAPIVVPRGSAQPIIKLSNT